MKHIPFAETNSDWGINPALFAIQILNLVIIVLWIWATWKMISFVCKKGKGAEVPLWVLVIVLLPIIGAFAAYIHYRNKTTQA
jgi:hypothetical protein